jgi:hypothetical protein
LLSNREIGSLAEAIDRFEGDIPNAAKHLGLGLNDMKRRINEAWNDLPDTWKWKVALAIDKKHIPSDMQERRRGTPEWEIHRRYECLAQANYNNQDAAVLAGIHASSFTPLRDDYDEKARQEWGYDPPPRRFAKKRIQTVRAEDVTQEDLEALKSPDPREPGPVITRYLPTPPVSSPELMEAYKATIAVMMEAQHTTIQVQAHAVTDIRESVDLSLQRVDKTMHQAQELMRKLFERAERGDNQGGTA